MSQNLEAASAAIRAMGDRCCENQMYAWPGFRPSDEDPAAFFAKEGVEFDGVLDIHYPANRTYRPMPMRQIREEEAAIGVSLPQDYVALLQEFGEFHLPGTAGLRFYSPSNASRFTRSAWCNGDKPLAVLAIAPFDETSDGNGIGFVREGNSFPPALYEFNHELLYESESDSTVPFARKISDDLAEFILAYLNRIA